MPNIEVKDLDHSIGTELFADAESFLEDLNDEAIGIVGGGGAIAVKTILNEPTAFGTTKAEYPHPTPPVIDPYNPNPGGNSGINWTGIYTTGPVPPHKPYPRHPKHE